MTKIAFSFLIFFTFIAAMMIGFFYITGNMTLFYLSCWIPTFTAVITLLVSRQTAELKILISSFRFTTGLIRALPILLCSAVLTGTALLVFIRIFGLKTPYSLRQSLINIPVMFLTGAIGEELGWRGVFLKQMLKKSGFIISSITMGGFWAASHLPLWLIPELEPLGYSGNPFWLFTVSLITSSFIYTWVFICSRGSLLSCVLLHFIQNYILSFTINLNTEPSNFFSAYTIINSVIALVIIANRKKIEREHSLLVL